MSILTGIAIDKGTVKLWNMYVLGMNISKIKNYEEALTLAINICRNVLIYSNYIHG